MPLPRAASSSASALLRPPLAPPGAGGVGSPSPVEPAVPGYGVPPPGRVVAFSPVRVRGGPRSGRAGRWRGRVLVAGLLVGALWWAMPGFLEPQRLPEAEGAGSAAARASASAAGPGSGPRDSSGAASDAGSGSAAGTASGGRFVAAPVRLADGGTAGLLRAGDRVDVLAAMPAAAGGGPGNRARRIATCAEVLRVPGGPAPKEPRKEEDATAAPWPGFGTTGGDSEGALILLRVRRATAEALAGATAGPTAPAGTAESGRLVVAVC
ncbi:hypothetical protein CH313_21275 [Streptomyces sp. TSRI0384-2]|nr:hypothetical protein [Streptomyces sp. SID7982]PJM81929.1 hypothetical protein CH313_21275 [Streptomyces sp. TSRI0384-2]